MSRTTVFRNAAWVVSWDSSQACHVYRRNVDLVIRGKSIVFVGKDYTGEADVEVSCEDRLILPGFVNVHSHPTSEPLRKGITDETRSPGFWHSSLYEFLPVLQNDQEGMLAAMQVALAELMMSGVTTVVDLSFPFDGWLEALGQSGIRAVAAPMFRDGRWYTRNGYELNYEWDEAAGCNAFDAARHTIELAEQHPSGRLSGMVCPAQIDTCSGDLIKTAYAYAVQADIPFQIHAAQSVNEFHEMFRRHGATPIQWLDKLGVLTQRTIVGHGIFLDHHPWLHWTTNRDLSLLSESGTTIAHCPTVFMRRGMALHTIGSYLRSGVKIAIGTDTYPHNFLEEMRNALTVARAVAGNVDDVTTSDVFNAATLGGADALQRTDIGRLTEGAKADLVLVDVEHPAMRPLREPIRNLVYVAADRAIREVYVDGERVVSNGRSVTVDYEAASQALDEAQKRSMRNVLKLDWANRSMDEMAPLSLPISDR